MTLLAGLTGDVGHDTASRFEALAASSNARVRGRRLQAAGMGTAAVCGNWTCLLTGRLDGIAELRAALDAPDEPPAAVLARLAALHGEAAPARVRGAFAAVLWDGSLERGYAVVDQLGVRSLHWSAVQGGIAFAADLRDLLELLPAAPSPERADVLGFLTSGAVRPDRTLLRGVRRLRGGRLLRLGGRATEQQYWEARYADPLGGSFTDVSALVRERIVEATARRLPERGAAGLLLSGGLDSLTVAAAASAAGRDTELRPYSGVFPLHREIDESELIAGVAARMNAPWTRSEITAGRPVLGAIEHLAHWRVPSPAPGVFLWGPLLHRAAADGVTVLLDGEGGDELFGAAPYFLADLLRRGRLREAREAAARLPGVGPAPPAEGIRRLVRHYGVPATMPWSLRWVARRGRDPRAHLPRYLRVTDARTARAVTDPWTWMRRSGPRWWAHLAHSLTDERQRLDAHGFLHRRARQYGLIDAHPLLQDFELVELALRIPPRMRHDPRHDRPLVREAMRGMVPEPQRLRQGKSYFNEILGAGLLGPDHELVERLLRPRDAALAEYVEHPSLVAQLLDTPPERYARGRVWWASDLWRAASLEAWLRELREPGWAATEAERGGIAVEQVLVVDARG